MLIPGVRAHDYGTDTPENLFSRISGDGWQTIQLAFAKAIKGVQLPNIPREVIEETKTALKENNLTVGVLGAYIEPSLSDETQRIYETSVFCSQIPLAAALNAGCIGTETTNMEKQPSGTTREQALRNLRVSLETMLQKAEECGVDIAIEPVYNHALSTPEAVRELIRDMASKHLKVIFDPVNLLAPDLVSKQQDLYERAFDCFGDRIAAVHMKGVQCRGTEMLPCSYAASILDYTAIFEKLNRISGNIPLLREEADPKEAAVDLSFFRRMMDAENW